MAAALYICLMGALKNQNTTCKKFIKNNQGFSNIIMKKSIIIFLFFFAEIYSSFAQDDVNIYTHLSLQQCIDIALKNNTDVQSKKLSQETEETNLMIAKGNRLPTVNADITHGANQGRSIDPFSNAYVNQNVSFANYGLNTGIVLFNGFAIQDNIKSNKFSVQAAQQETQQVKDNLALNVILGYLNILTNQDLLEQAKKQKEVTQKQADRLETLNANGAINPGQWYDLKGQLAADELIIINTRNSLDVAVLTLTQLLNIPYTNTINFDRVGLTEAQVQSQLTADSVYETALSNLAALKAVDLRKQSANYAVKANRASRYPTLSLNGGVYTNYSSAATTLNFINTTEEQTNAYIIIDGTQTPVFAKQDNFSNSKLGYGNQFKNNFNTSISIGINIPLLNGLQTKARIKNAEIQQKQADITALAARNTLKQNTAQALFNLQAAQDRYKILEQQKDAFTQSYNVANTRLENGVINTVEYLIAKNNLDRTSSNLIIARYDYILRNMVMDYYKGSITFQ